MNFKPFIRTLLRIAKALSKAFLVSLLAGFVMAMTAQLLGRETEFSLSLFHGLSFKSQPTQLSGWVAQTDMPGPACSRSDHGVAVASEQ
jgi:hypothetical protein